MQKKYFKRHFFIFRMDSQIPFFCGDSQLCRTVGSGAALKAAIRNIETKVGARAQGEQGEFAQTEIIAAIYFLSWELECLNFKIVK